jgi:hypothetical protein
VHEIAELLNGQFPLDELVTLLGQGHLFPHGLEAHGPVAPNRVNRTLLVQVSGFGSPRELGQALFRALCPLPADENAHL